MDPTTAETAPPRRLKLRLLICNPKSYGAKNIQVKGRTSGNIPRTREDPYLPSFYSYECKSAQEWRDIAASISKSVTNQHSFFATAHYADMDLLPGPDGRVEMDAVVATAIADIPQATISPQQEGPGPSEAHNLGEAGATPAPATTSAPEEAPAPIVSEETPSPAEQAEEPSDFNRAEDPPSVESEGTPSAPEIEDGSASDGTGASVNAEQVEEPAPRSAPASDPPAPAPKPKPKPAPAKKAAKGKK